MKKRIFSLVLAVMMIVSTCVIVSAAQTSVLDKATFETLDVDTWDVSTQTYASGTTAANFQTLYEGRSGLKLGGTANAIRSYNIVDSGDATRGKYFEMKKVAGSGTPWTWYPKTAGATAFYTQNNDVFVYEFDFLRSGFDSTTKTSPFYVVGSAVGVSNISLNFMEIFFTGENVSITGSETTGTITTLPQDVWHHAKITFDLSNKRRIVTFTNGSTSAVTTDIGMLENATSASSAGRVYNSLTQVIFRINNQNGTNYDGAATLGIDNVEMYTVSKPTVVSSVPANNADNVLVDESVSITLSENVAESSLSNLVVKAGNETVSNTEYNASVSGKVVTVDFNNPMEFNTTYTILVDGLTNTDGISFASGAKVVYTTEEAPAVQITDISYSKGYGASYVEDVATLTDGAFHTAKISLKNNTAQAKNATVILSVYDSTNKLVNCQYVNVALAAGEETGITNGLSFSGCVGGKVRVFVWDSPESLRPWMVGIGPETVAAN